MSILVWYISYVCYLYKFFTPAKKKTVDTLKTPIKKKKKNVISFIPQ